MVSTLNRYFSRELALTFVSVSSILLIVIVSKAFISLLTRVVDGKLPSDVVLSILALGILNSAILLAPFALLITIMLVLGRLYRDSEIYAIKACGIGQFALLRYASLLIVPLIIGLFYLSIYLGPWASNKIEQIKVIARAQTDIHGLIPGQFIEAKQGNWVVFIEDTDKETGQVKNIFIYDRREGNVAIETAQSAEQKNIEELGGESLILNNGQRYEGVPGKSDFTLLLFNQHAIRVPELDSYMDHKDPEFMSTRALIQTGRLNDYAELQWRFSVPIAAILLALLAFPLSVTNPRQGRFAKLGIVIVIYLIYSNLLVLAETWVADGKLPVFPGMLLVHFMLALLIGVLVFKQNYSR